MSSIRSQLDEIQKMFPQSRLNEEAPEANQFSLPIKKRLFDSLTTWAKEKDAPRSALKKPRKTIKSPFGDHRRQINQEVSEADQFSHPMKKRLFDALTTWTNEKDAPRSALKKPQKMIKSPFGDLRRQINQEVSEVDQFSLPIKKRLFEALTTWTKEKDEPINALKMMKMMKALSRTTANK